MRIWKIGGTSRASHVMLLADVIKRPDEIWLRWEEYRDRPGTWSLRRRFIARRRIEGDSREMLGAFEYGEDGWKGATVMLSTRRNPAARLRYLNSQRSGLLIYRRKS